MDPSSLISIAKNAKSISDFVLGNGVKEAILGLVGDVHVDAAKNIIRLIEQSNNPGDRVNSIITHLEAATAAYASEIKKFKSNSFRAGFNLFQVEEIIDKNSYVSCLLALCYISAGEDNLALIVVDQAIECNDTLNWTSSVDKILSRTAAFASPMNQRPRPVLKVIDLRAFRAGLSA